MLFKLIKNLLGVLENVIYNVNLSLFEVKRILCKMFEVGLIYPTSLYSCFNNV